LPSLSRFSATYRPQFRATRLCRLCSPHRARPAHNHELGGKDRRDVRRNRAGRVRGLLDQPRRARSRASPQLVRDPRDRHPAHDRAVPDRLDIVIFMLFLVSMRIPLLFSLILGAGVVGSRSSPSACLSHRPPSSTSARCSCCCSQPWVTTATSARPSSRWAASHCRSASQLEFLRRKVVGVQPAICLPVTGSGPQGRRTRCRRGRPASPSRTRGGCRRPPSPRARLAGLPPPPGTGRSG
jgi:hypothetical protein